MYFEAVFIKISLKMHSNFKFNTDFRGLLRLATGRAAVTNCYLHRMFC